MQIEALSFSSVLEDREAAQQVQAQIIKGPRLIRFLLRMQLPKEFRLRIPA